MTITDLLVEYQDGEIWAQRNHNGYIIASSPAKLVPSIGDPDICLENHSYICSADHSRDEVLKLSATVYSHEDIQQAIDFINEC